MKKLWVNTMALIMTLGMGASLASCGKKDDGIDRKGKKAINMSFYIGEFGEWVKDMSREWSNANDQWYIEPKSNKNLSNVVINDIKSGSEFDIFMTEDANFHSIYSDKYLEDLTDVFNSKVDGENGKTVLEKVRNIDLMESIISKDGKYYALPTSLSPVGLIFDYDRFKENNWLMTDGNGEITAGRDGVKGTYDDGQPQTMAEFQEMCDAIKEVTDDVFLYMGVKAGEYLNNVAFAHLAQTLGEEKYEIFRNHDSKGVEVEMMDGSVRAFDIDDGYMSYQMKGFENMFEFMANFLANSRYSTTSSRDEFSMGVNESHIHFITVDSDMPGFLIEGNWWEYGSRVLIDSNEDYGGKPYGTSDYRYMLIPNENENGGKSVVFSQTGGTVIVKKQSNSEKAAAIKDFLRFLYKNDTMARVTSQYGMLWNMDYTIEGATRENMTKFTANAFDMVQDTDNVIVRNSFLDATIPLKTYSEHGTYSIIQGKNRDADLFNILKTEKYNAAKATTNIQEWNSASKWAGYVAMARTYGYYND